MTEEMDQLSLLYRSFRDFFHLLHDAMYAFVDVFNEQLLRFPVVFNVEQLLV